MKLSIVIPCYNEEKNLPLLLEKCVPLQKHGGIEVILVNNGSTDNTEFVLETLLPQYPHCRTIKVEENRGYGFGIVSGLKSAKGDILAWTHADMQTDPNDAVKGLSFFNQHGKDIFVKGQRYGRPFHDTVFTIAMSIFETCLLKTQLWDINAQPTMFSRDFFESWVEPPQDFSLDLFAYYVAKHNKLNCYRFPVLFDQRAHGTSHWNLNWHSKKNFIKRTVNFSFQLKKRL